MSTIIKLRRDTESNWKKSNYILEEGEVGVVTDNLASGSSSPVEFRIGNGSSGWNDLNSQYLGNPVQSFNINGINATVANQTASFDISSISSLSNYASSASAITGITTGYTPSTGQIDIYLTRANSSTLMTSVSVQKVPSASFADSIVTTRVKTDPSSSTVSASTLDWLGDTGSLGIVNTFKFEPAYSTTQGHTLLTTASSGSYLYLDGVSKTARYAEKDVDGNIISSTYAKLDGDPDFSNISCTGGKANLTEIHCDSLDNLSGNLYIGENSDYDVYVYATKVYSSTASFGDVTASDISASGDVTCNNVYAKGDVVSTYISDRRLKKNIELITPEESTKIISSLRPVEFEWNEKAEELSGGHKTGKSRGFIADEFLKLLPNAGRKVWNEYDAIDYIQVIPYLVAECQRLQKELDELKSKI